MSDPFGSLMPSEDATDMTILQELLNTDNLMLKTDIKDVDKFVVLNVLINWLKENNLTNSADILEQYSILFMKAMISIDRKSRKEIVGVLMGKMENTKMESNLTKDLKK